MLNGGFGKLLIGDQVADRTFSPFVRPMPPNLNGNIPGCSQFPESSWFFGFDRRAALLASAPGHLSFVLAMAADTIASADTTRVAGALTTVVARAQGEEVGRHRGHGGSFLDMDLGC